MYGRHNNETPTQNYLYDLPTFLSRLQLPHAKGHLRVPCSADPLFVNPLPLF